MLSIFKPTWMLESAYHLQPDNLKARGYKAILTDLDNTLIAWDDKHLTERALVWIDDLQSSDIPVIVISNNTKGRVHVATQQLDSPVIASAKKPFKFGLKQALNLVDVPKSKILLVGDQMITDVIGANRMGIDVALVKPLVESDAWNTKLNRYIESKILNYLMKKNPEMKWSQSLHE